MFAETAIVISHRLFMPSLMITSHQTVKVNMD